MKSIPKWIQVGGWIVTLLKLADAATLAFYPIALIPSRTTNVDSLYLAHRIISTDLALAAIVIFGLTKKQPLVLAAAFIGLILNEGLDSITLYTNYLHGNLEPGALVGIGAAVIFILFYIFASKTLLQNNK